MKKFLVCLFAAAAIFATSCSKDDDEPSTKATATIEGGQSYTFSDYAWDNQFGKYNLFSCSLDLTNNLMISLKENKTGKIAIDENNSITLQLDEVDYKAVDGTITVDTFNDKTVSGSYTGSFKTSPLIPAKKISGTFCAEKMTE